MSDNPKETGANDDSESFLSHPILVIFWIVIFGLFVLLMAALVKLIIGHLSSMAPARLHATIQLFIGITPVVGLPLTFLFFGYKWDWDSAIWAILFTLVLGFSAFVLGGVHERLRMTPILILLMSQSVYFLWEKKRNKNPADQNTANLLRHAREGVTNTAAGAEEDWRPARRGLVLEGGGAKGAWQFGVLQAFAESDIKFDVVSGTSVGALNGAIWCAGRLDIGKQMWGSMSLSRVFAPRIWLIPFVFLGLLSRVAYAFFQGYASPKAMVMRILYSVFSLVMVIPMCLSTLWFIWMEYNVFRPPEAGGHAMLIGTLVFFIIIYSVLIVFMLGVQELEVSQGVFILIALGWGYLPITLGLTCVLGPPGGGHVRECEAFQDGILLLGAVPFGLLAIAWLLRIANVSLFLPLPLENTISKVLSDGIRVPLLVTSAVDAAYFDPDHIEYVTLPTGATNWLSGNVTHTPRASHALVPIYTRVDHLDVYSAREALLASSALPLGVVASRRGRDGVRHVDGGVADNLPWFPLISEYRCEEIVIVCCNPTVWDDGLALKIWQRIDRIRRTVALKFVPGGSDFSSLPLRNPASWPSKVIVIAPEHVLGSFLSGTMGFSTKRCQIRMAEGYASGRRVITSILATESAKT